MKNDSFKNNMKIKFLTGLKNRIQECINNKLIDSGDFVVTSDTDELAFINKAKEIQFLKSRTNTQHIVNGKTKGKLANDYTIPEGIDLDELLDLMSQGFLTPEILREYIVFGTRPTIDQEQDVLYIENNIGYCWSGTEWIKLFEDNTTSLQNFQEKVKQLEQNVTNNSNEIKKVSDAIPTQISNEIEKHDKLGTAHNDIRQEIVNSANTKINKQQGVENVGKALMVGADGNIAAYKNIIPISEIANHLPDSEIVVNQKHQNQLVLTVSDSMPIGTIKTFYVDIPLFGYSLYTKNKTTGEKALKKFGGADTLNGSIINVVKNKEKQIYVIFYGITTVNVFNFDANGDFLSQETTTTIKGLERLELPSNYTPTNDGDISTKKYVDESVLAKVDKQQGTENKGKVVTVGEDGNVTTLYPNNVTYNSATNNLEYGSNDTLPLSDGVKLDTSLTKSGFAADAKVVNDKLAEKISIAQGVENAGKALVVGVDGNVGFNSMSIDQNQILNLLFEENLITPIHAGNSTTIFAETKTNTIYTF